MNQTFLEVQQALLAALHQKPFNHIISHPKAFYNMTMENGLSGLIFSVLENDKTDPELYRRLNRNHYDYIARDIKQLEAIKTIDTWLNEAHIDHLFMKGSILKTYYPETYMRAMGDIDILIRSSSLLDVHALFKKHDVVCTSKSKQHDVFEMPNKIVIEVHPSLYKPFNEHYELIEHVWDHTHIEEDHRYRMNPEFELIYLLYHLAKHIESGGIGLRSVLDIGFYLIKMEDRLDKEILNSMLDKTKLTQFFNVIGYVLDKTFHMNTSIQTITALNDETYEGFIDYLITSGIHGIGSQNNIMTPRMVTYKRKKKSKFRLFIDIMFPNMETMIGMYPWLNKAKILLPTAWIFRWIKIMIKRPKQSLKKVKQLQLSSKEIEDKQRLFEKIGL